MKKIIFVLALVLAGTISADAHRYYTRHRNVTLFTFYRELSPYGDWVRTPEFGYAWIPRTDEAEDFRPYYTRGEWVYTDYGWTWASDYRWGWATFHYGRWHFDDYYGWMWLPGYEWAPAWVTWGEYNDCYAWAPLGPRIEVNINIGWQPPAFWWTAVPYRHFCSRDWHHYAWDRPVQVTNITNITNIYYGDSRHGEHGNKRGDGRGNWYHGPRVTDVERNTGSKVARVDPVVAERTRQEITRNDPSSVRTKTTGNTVTRTTNPATRPEVSAERTARPPVHTTPAETRTTVTRTTPKTEPVRISPRQEPRTEVKRTPESRTEPRRDPASERTRNSTEKRDPAPAPQPKKETVKSRETKAEPSRVSRNSAEPKVRTAERTTKNNGTTRER